MEDNDDNIDQLHLGEFEKDDEEIVSSNIEQDNKILLNKGRISANSTNSANSNIDGQPVNRFTIVENNFSEGPSEIKDDTEEVSKKNKKVNFINLKIILVGDVSVGKTCIIGRYINNYFSEDYNCTIQAEQQTKIIKEDDNTSIKMNIWDTIGQEKFRAITRQYYRDCDGAIIVFDLTKKKTFEGIGNWIKDIIEYGNNDTKIIIAGNKSDLTGEREISQNDIKDKLKEFEEDFLYYEISAKNGNNIAMIFEKLKKLIMENKIKKEEKEKEKEKENKDKKNKNKKSKNKTDNIEEKRSKSLNEFNKNFNEKNKKCC